MATSIVVGFRALFLLLGCFMLVTLIYTISIHGSPFRKDIITPWMAELLVDFYINVIALSAWVSYKESKWINALIWIILLFSFGSVATCAYVFVQFLKLRSQDSFQDVMYNVLMRHTNKDDVEHRTKHSSVVIAKVVFSALGCVMLATLLYTLITDGSPFRKELYTPWVETTIIDFYINVMPLSVWVIYKESSWITAIFWIVLLISFGSITTCSYIVLQLWQLTSQDPLYLILVNSGNRAENRCERTTSYEPI